MQALREELEASKEELNVSAGRVCELETEVEDKQAAVKIAEKKSLVMVSSYHRHRASL